MRKEIEPTIHRDGDEEVETHPAYGVVSVSRCNGNSRLFGSALENHSSYVSLRVRRCERRHGLGRDWFFARDHIIEINMSNAQFAEMITTLNVGDGVPCTIQRIMGEDMPGISPAMKTEAEKVGESFKSDQLKFVSKLRAAIDSADEILSKKGNIVKADRQKIRGILGHIMTEVASNQPFAVESFQRAAEKVVTQSKAEVDAFVTSAVHRLGVSKLSELVQGDEQKKLGE